MLMYMKKIAEAPHYCSGVRGKKQVEDLPDKVVVLKIQVNNIPNYKGLYNGSVLYGGSETPLWTGEYDSPEKAWSNCQAFIRECYTLVDMVKDEEIKKEDIKKDIKKEVIREEVHSREFSPHMSRSSPSMRKTRGMW